MDKKYVYLIIIPDYDDINHIIGYNPNIYGKVISTATEIKVNQLQSGAYSIIYHLNVLNTIKPSRLISSILTMFKNNLPNVLCEYSIRLIGFEYVNNYDKKMLLIPKLIHNMMINIYHSNTVENMVYKTSTDMAELDSTNHMVAFRKYEDEDDLDGLWDSFEDFEEDDESNEDDEEDSEEDEYDSLHSLLDNYGRKSKKRKNHNDYPRSRVFKDSDSPRKEINRHGIIIAQSKEDIKRDEKIIKDFLKDFIPGNASWKKNFRKELTMRWLKVYTVSKKELKRLEKDYRHKKDADKRSKSTAKKLEFARNLFTIPVSNWYDPTK